MKVRALDRGFYGTIRKAGEEFELHQDSDFSSVWMEDAKAKHPAPAEREPERVVVSQGSKVVLPRKDDLGPEFGELPKPRPMVTRDPGPGATVAQMHGLTDDSMRDAVSDRTAAERVRAERAAAKPSSLHDMAEKARAKAASDKASAAAKVKDKK